MSLEDVAVTQYLVVVDDRYYVETRESAHLEDCIRYSSCEENATRFGLLAEASLICTALKTLLNREAVCKIIKVTTAYIKEVIPNE